MGKIATQIPVRKKLLDIIRNQTWAGRASRRSRENQTDFQRERQRWDERLLQRVKVRVDEGCGTKGVDVSQKHLANDGAASDRGG